MGKKEQTTKRTSLNPYAFVISLTWDTFQIPSRDSVNDSRVTFDFFIKRLIHLGIENIK